MDSQKICLGIIECAEKHNGQEGNMFEKLKIMMLRIKIKRG